MDAYALVTGGSGRIGGAICNALHAAGANVIIHAYVGAKTAAQRAERLNAAVPGSARVLVEDLHCPFGTQRLARQARAISGDRMTWVVNCAASYMLDTEGQDGWRRWDDMMALNAKAPWIIATELSSALKSNGGAIVNIADSHVERPLAGFSAYTASKAALLGVTKAMAVDLAPQVRVNAVAPGLVVCEDDIPHDAVEREQIARRSALERHASQAEIVRAVLFLLRDATFMTGEVLYVDGGRAVRFLDRNEQPTGD